MSKTAFWAVLSSQQQWDAYRRLSPGAVGTLFCDNPAFYPSLSREKIPFRPLDEWVLRREWSEINRWGAEAAVSWEADADAASAFSDIRWSSVIFLFFSHLLIHALKNRRLAQICLQDETPERMLLFRGEGRDFPQYSGNAYLTYFLRQLLLERGITPEETQGASVSANAERFFGAIGPKERLKRRLGGLVCALSGRPPKDGLLVQGSLRHLGEVAALLRRRGAAVWFADETFNLTHFIFCLKNRVAYTLLPEAISQADDALRTDDLARIRRSFDRTAARGVFVKGDYDFAPFIREQILSRLAPFIRKARQKWSRYRLWGERYTPTALLTDEDYALRGGLLADWMRKRGGKLFCISHANTPVNFEVSERSRSFGPSVTFVHSEFERRNYAARGWDPARIRITGTPRYDRLIRMRQKPAAHRAEPRLLYCANSFIAPQTPNEHGYLGVSVSSFESVTGPASDAILRAAEASEVDLFIKPHNVEGVHTWRERLRGYRLKSARIATDPNTDFFSCLSASDGMILSGWSTALVEAALFRVPILFVDLQGTLGPAALSFLEAAPGCAVARTAAEVASWVTRWKKGDLKCSAPLLDRDTPDEFLGYEDGLSAQRVSDEIARVILRPSNNA